MDIRNEVDTFVLNNIPVLTADSSKSKINWLKGLAPKFNRIVHFGSAQGEQTLALAWILGAAEVVGVDNDPAMVEAANALKTNFYADLKKLNDATRTRVSQMSGDRQAAFLVEFRTYFAGLSGEAYEAVLQKYKTRKFPDFIECDLSNQVNPKCIDNERLKEGYFDLVFADHVLELIAFKNRTRDDALAYAAVEEMVRVAKQGGVLVAIAPQVFEFKDIFESFPLKRVLISEALDIFEDFNVYVYRKMAQV
jgi:SAM-dependent methyltransferase